MIATAKQGMSRDYFREAGYWLDKTVDQLLTEAAARTPDKVSIVADRADRDHARLFTYRELEALTNRFARALTALGVAKGDRVCILSPNCPEYIIAFYAIARVGAVASPMNPSYRERAQQMAASIASAGGEVRAADIIESALEGIENSATSAC